MFKILLIEDDTTLFQEIKDKERYVNWSDDVYEITDFYQVMQEFTC